MALRNNDKITYDTPPKYLKHPVSGREFIATEGLIKRGDMIAIDKLSSMTDDVEDVTDIEEEEISIKAFDVSRATKQQIVDEAMKAFGVELSMDDTGAVLKASYNQLKADVNASNNSDNTTGS